MAGEEGGPVMGRPGWSWDIPYHQRSPGEPMLFFCLWIWIMAIIFN